VAQVAEGSISAGLSPSHGVPVTTPKAIGERVARLVAAFFVK
jgi:hypothetical protein